MKKMFSMVLLASAVVVACSGKKASTTPTTTPQEMNGDPAGGATYGGQKAKVPDGKATPTPYSPGSGY